MSLPVVYAHRSSGSKRSVRLKGRSLSEGAVIEHRKGMQRSWHSCLR